MAQKWPIMTQNGAKINQNGPKMAKNDPRWPKMTQNPKTPKPRVIFRFLKYVFHNIEKFSFTYIYPNSLSLG